MQTSELGRLQVLAGIIDRYEQYIPALPETSLTLEEEQEIESKLQLLETRLFEEMAVPDNVEDKQTAKKVAKIILTKLMSLMKKIMTFGKEFVKIGLNVAKVFARGVWGIIKFLWRHKFAVAIVAALGAQYTWMIEGMNWMSSVLPDWMISMFGGDPETMEPLGDMYAGLHAEKIKAGWDSLADWFGSYEGQSWMTMPIDAFGEWIESGMDLVGLAVPAMIDAMVPILKAMQKIGFDIIGGILSWVFLVGAAANVGDWLYEKTAPIYFYIKGWFVKEDIRDEIVKAVEQEVGKQTKSDQDEVPNSIEDVFAFDPEPAT